MMMIDQQETPNKLRDLLDESKKDYNNSNIVQFRNTTPGTYATFSVMKPTTQVPRIISSNNTKPYQCPKCYQSFSRPHNLKSHLTTHSSERPFKCGECNQHFRRQHDLKRHQKLHSGERPYVCNDCFRSFARMDSLTRHQRAEGGTACQVAIQQRKKSIEMIIKAPPPQNLPKEVLLPSPSALNTLPLMSDTLKPISLPTPSSPPRLTLPPITPNEHSPKENVLNRLVQENTDLKRDIDQIRYFAHNDLSALKSKLHDLQVENQVLRSLVHKQKTSM